MYKKNSQASYFCRNVFFHWQASYLQIGRNAGLLKITNSEVLLTKIAITQTTV